MIDWENDIVGETVEKMWNKFLAIMTGLLMKPDSLKSNNKSAQIW